MASSLKPFPHWTSAPGKRLLSALADGSADLKEASERLQLADWESALIRRALRAKEGFASHRIKPSERTERRGYLAQTLDYLRLQATRHPPVSQNQRGFRGNRKHLEMLARSARVPIEENEWNRWRARQPRTVPDLRGADLSMLRLGELNLDRARLNGANLSETNLRGAKLRGADLRKARFNGAHLYGCSLQGADLRQAWFQDALLASARLEGADLRGATFIGCSLNEANLSDADLRDSFVWGTSVWQVQTSAKTKQANIGIGWDLFDPIDALAFGLEGRARAQFNIRVDDIRVADFISLVSTRRDSIATIMDAASSRLVLILGRFLGRQKQVLRALETALSEIGYVPMVFDFREPKDRDLVETISVLAGLSKFVIADLTDPRSTPLESQLIIPSMAIPFVPLVRKGELPFSMFRALQRKYPWVLEPVTYTSEAGLLKTLKQRIVKPAEALATALRLAKHAGIKAP